MVSSKQFELILRTSLWVTAIVVFGTLVRPVSAENNGPKFFADDPLLREPEPIAVNGITTRTVDSIYDFLENSYVTPRRQGKIAKRAPRRALDVNTVGEVPDSPWYTNRHSWRRMSIPQLQRGPGNSAPPNPEGVWRITAAKSNGITPGFVIEDAQKRRYVLKLDPPLYPELCSAADVIGSKFFYALGYNTPENYIVNFRRDQLEISEGVVYRDPSGKKTPLTDRVVDELLRAQPKSADGAYRALASRWLDGKVVGPFDYSGTRSDDPNDTIAHEDRRVLRGLSVFSAWLGHHDTSQINTMDVLVTEDGTQYIKHYLIDFGSILGSRGNGPKAPWIGHQYSIDHKETLLRALSLGVYVSRWERSNYANLRGIGRFDAWSFDPLIWKPEVPNPAFLMADNADAFWAAKQVADFTDDEIRAIVETGQLTDPSAAEWIADCLIKRRDKIAQAWFSKVLPLDRFHVAEGRLAFEDLRAKYANGNPGNYDIEWSTYNNDHGVLTPLGNGSGTTLPSVASETGYLAATIRCAANPAQSCPAPVTVYIRRSEKGFEVVGVDR